VVPSLSYIYGKIVKKVASAVAFVHNRVGTIFEEKFVRHLAKERGWAMKAKFLSIIILCYLLTVLNISKADITDVYITPEVPNTTDNITIFVSGIQSAGFIEINNSEFHIDGTSLELDLFLNVGFLQVLTPWDYFEDIGTLPAGTYDLLIKTDQPAFSDPEDTYSITFEVIPEPTSTTAQLNTENPKHEIASKTRRRKENSDSSSL